MDVSIIIVNLNSFKILKDCINSIINYTNKKIEYEIIIVDNNSDEGSIETELNGYTCVRLIQNKYNMGFAAANNEGIKIAKGKYILFLNNDTLFIEDSISVLLDFYSNSNQNIIGCKILNADMTIQPSINDKDTLLNSFGENFFLYKIFPQIRSLNRWYLSQYVPQEIIQVDLIKGCFIFCEKKIIDELNGFDERFFFYAEETDLCLRAVSKGYKIIYYPETAIIHLGGYTTEKNLWFKYKNRSFARIQIFQKHYPRKQLYFLIAFHYGGIFLRVFVYFFLGVFSFNSKLFMKSFLYIKQLFVYPKNLFKNS
ncbi:MAG: hypothetical protein STSR0008_18750 [Ignavibacterium sp.]